MHSSDIYPLVLITHTVALCRANAYIIYARLIFSRLSFHIPQWLLDLVNGLQIVYI